jgi:hypothetical protein
VKNLASDDPFELITVARPLAVDIETDRETATCLIEEYALTGFTAHEILELFASPTYAMPNAIFSRRGPSFVRELIEGVFGGSW